MTILEKTAERRTHAADSRFFIAPEKRVGPNIMDMIGKLDAIAADSAAARLALATLTEDEHKTYRGLYAKFVAGNRDPQVVAAVGYGETLAGRAGMYNDIASTVQRSGIKLVGEVADHLGSGFMMINGQPYWRHTDYRGKNWVCTDDMDAGERVYFNRWDRIDEENSRQANLSDYVQLITNVESSLAFREQTYI